VTADRVARLTPLVLVPAALAALALAGCSSDDSTAADSAAPTAASSTTTTCPTDVAASSAAADWTLAGVSGSVAVVAPTADRAPRITVQAPFTVDETTVKTLKAGTGAEVTSDSVVTFCYHGVNGRDGSTFDDSYEKGAPIEFGATELVPGFTKALVGQRVGATVAVAVTPQDGYPQGTPDGSIKPGDSIVFALTILKAS